MNVLDEWLEQKFFGKEANIGEDRALTNLMLRQGKSVLFQKNANVYTSIPETYKKLCKMFIRWGRSNARENLKMAGFVFKNFRSHHRTSARLLLLMQLAWCFPSPIIFAITVWTFLMFPVQFVASSLAGGAVWSTVTAFFYYKQYRSFEALWSYVYGVFHFVALSWIVPYALLTVRQTGWLTRSLDQAVRVTSVQMPKTAPSSTKLASIQVPAHSE
jgi:hyaluronan synthase